MVQVDRQELARTLAEEAYRIVAATRRADIRHVEEDFSGAARLELVRAIVIWLSDTANLLDTAERSFSDGEAGDDEPETPRQLIVDVAGMASMAVEAKKRLIEQIDETTDHWQVIDRCDSSLRAIVRTVTALEHALAAFAGDSPLLVADDELDKGLRIRRLYEKFRRAIREHAAAEDRPLVQRIRSAGTSLAILVGHHEYPLMRVGDRILIRKLHQRVIEWITAPAHDEVDGRHLCSELLSVAELLMAISSRAELIEYDRRHTGSTAIGAEKLSNQTKEGD